MTPDELHRFQINLASLDYELVKGLSRVQSIYKMRRDIDSSQKISMLLGIYSKGGDFSEENRELAKTLIQKANERQV